MGTIPAFGVFDIDRSWSNGFPLLQVRAPCGGFDTSGPLIIAKTNLANRYPHDFTFPVDWSGSRLDSAAGSDGKSAEWSDGGQGRMWWCR